MLPGRALLCAVLSLAAVPQVVRAADTAVSLAERSMQECESGRSAADRTERKEHFDRGQGLAEQAVKLDDSSADAHFALFCNLGELMRIDGESVKSLLSLRQLMRELDRTIELDPDNLDALSSKGSLLVRLPRLLGGDATQGEALLRRVIREDPTAFTARLSLATALEQRGDRDQAITFARRALQVAREQGRADKIAKAQEALAELGAGR